MARRARRPPPLGPGPGVPLTDNLVLTATTSRRSRAASSATTMPSRHAADEAIAEFDIRTPSRVPPEPCPAGTSRSSSLRASSSADLKLLVLDQPTAASTSVASSSSTARRSRTRRGTALLRVSAELDEVLELSDRIAVMYRGRARCGRGWPFRGPGRGRAPHGDRWRAKDVTEVAHVMNRRRSERRTPRQALVSRRARPPAARRPCRLSHTAGPVRRRVSVHRCIRAGGLEDRPEPHPAHRRLREPVRGCDRDQPARREAGPDHRHLEQRLRPPSQRSINALHRDPRPDAAPLALHGRLGGPGLQGRPVQYRRPAASC